MFPIQNQIIHAALHFAGKKDIRFYLNGLNFQSKNGLLFVTATDGSIIFTKQICEYSEPLNFTIVREHLEKLPKTGVTIISIDGEDVTIECASSTIHVKKIDGNYPDFWRLYEAQKDGECANCYNFELTNQVQKAAKILGVTFPRIIPPAAYGGLSRIDLKDETIMAAIMPIRKNETPPKKPAWACKAVQTEGVTA